MRPNPEFLRNRWLEITSHRLVVTPIITGAFYYFILFVGESGDEALVLTSLWMFILFSGLWGAYQSESAMVSEIQSKTWPLQRLTSISPWTMTWGKLFGSTLFSWYVGLWSLLVFAVTLLLVPEVALFPRANSKWILLSYGIGPALIFIVGLVVISQAWGFLLGMWQLQNKHSKSKRRSGLSAVLSLFFLIPMVIATFEPMRWARSIHWYHWEVPPFGFYLGTMGLALFWILTGIYMQMRRELQVSNAPWAWLLFVLMMAGYVMGFPQDDDTLVLNGLNTWVVRFLVGWGLMLAFSYFILLWERSDGIDIRRLFHLWESRRIRDSLCEIPRWLVSLIVTWAAAGVLMALHSRYTGTFMDEDGEMLNMYSVVLATLFFLMRDIALLLFFYFSEKPQRAIAAAMVYWAVLYGLIPLVLGLAWFKELIPMFIPDGKVSFAYAVLPPLAQALLMCTLTVRSWRRRFGASA